MSKNFIESYKEGTQNYKLAPLSRDACSNCDWWKTKSQMVSEWNHDNNSGAQDAWKSVHIYGKFTTASEGGTALGQIAMEGGHHDDNSEEAAFVASIERQEATGAITGINPALITARIGVTSTLDIFPTNPNSGFSMLAWRMPPSTPDRPIALPPSALKDATIPLFTIPVSTAMTISKLFASVTRNPRTNRGLTPWRSIHCEITLPPPCTSTGW